MTDREFLQEILRRLHLIENSLNKIIEGSK